jgi:hypothetical protein
MVIEKFMNTRGIKEYTIDGAIDDKQWAQEQNKVLFYLKENYGYQGCGVIKLEEHIHGWLQSRIKTIVNCITLKVAIDMALDRRSKLSYQEIRGVFNDNELLSLSLPKVAFLNVKKHSGESRSKDVEIRRESRANSELLAKQLKLLEPTLIMTGGTVCWHSLTMDINMFEKSIKCPKNSYANENGVTLFHLNHPSAPGYNLQKVHELMFESLA